MIRNESKKIAMIEQKVGAYLAPFGFTVGFKDGMCIEFIRTVEGVKQTIFVQHTRYGDKIRAQYDISCRHGPITPRLELDFVKNHCPWARPSEGEWVWYDGDEDFPHAIDKLVFMIEGVGFTILDELMDARMTDEEYALYREKRAKEAAAEIAEKPAEEPLAPKISEVNLSLSREQRTQLVKSLLGDVLFPLGFSFEGWDDVSDWRFNRYVSGNFTGLVFDRRGMYLADTNMAKQTAGVREEPGHCLLDVVLGANAWCDGERALEIRKTLRTNMKNDYPEDRYGDAFTYYDDESYIDALKKIADIIARYGPATLDALCPEREM